MTRFSNGPALIGQAPKSKLCRRIDDASSPWVSSMFRRADFRLAALTAAFAASALLAAPAAAQFSDSYSFLQAVEKRDGDEATKLLNDNDAGIVNTRHPDTGETALMIVVKRRDSTWPRFLLAKDADPSPAHPQGMTPRMPAARLAFTAGTPRAEERR